MPVAASAAGARRVPGAFATLDRSAPPPPIDLGTILTPGGAGELARQLVGAVTGLVQGLRIPLVTTELVGGRPRVTTTAVGSPDEAAAVADAGRPTATSSASRSRSGTGPPPTIPTSRS